MTNTMKGLRLLTGFLLLAGSLAYAGEKFEERFSKTEPLAADGKVFLSNVSGDIEIAVWKENKVKIEALKVSSSRSSEKARENAAKVTIDVRMEGDVLIIETKYPHKNGMWGDDSPNVEVNYKLFVPVKASIEVKSVSGDVHLGTLGGQAKVTSVSGDLEIRGAMSLKGSLVSGDAKIEDIGGDVEIETVSGDLTIRGIKGSIQAESVSGDVKISESVKAMNVGAKSVSGDIEYQGLIYDGGRYEFKSHSGDVVLHIPADSSFELEAKTFSGTIDSQFEIQVMGKISPRELRGTVGKGGASFRIATFSGDIELVKGN